MRYIENQCCGCATPGYPCIGEACSLRQSEVIICDYCGKEIEINDLDWDYVEFQGKDYHRDCWEISE